MPRPAPSDRFARIRARLEEEARAARTPRVATDLPQWTGTLGQPPEAPAMQPPETSRTFIARMARAIDDLDALDGF